MTLRSPEALIAALLKNELTWDDFQTAFRFFSQRERIVILEKLDTVVSTGTAQEKPRNAC
jgi:hypothetical protein